MSSQTLTAGGGVSGNGISRDRLFLASCLSLIATAMYFIVRQTITADWKTEFKLNDAELGGINSAAFYGFALSILFGGALVDALGTKRIFALAFVGHIIGIIWTLLSGNATMLFVGTLIAGIGNGLVEAAANPMIATMFAERKTQKLNAFHAWWAGGQILGGIVLFAMTQANLNWHLKLGSVLVLVVIYGVLFLGQKFPQTERVQAAVSTGAMYKEVLRPVFLLLAVCMVFTAATEFGPNGWIPTRLGKVIDPSSADPTGGTIGLVILVFINIVMLTGRSLAGTFVHRLSPVGLLAGSSIAAAIGLTILAHANSSVSAFLGAFVFALGICYYWPTMLGLVSERFPRGGSLLLGIMGAVGNLGAAQVLPFMGKINDEQGPAVAFQKVVVLPVILAIVFAALYFSDRTKGGYKAEILNAPLSDKEPMATPL